MGRKRYKELMNRFNAAQKIIELQKKRAEADTARKVSGNNLKMPPPPPTTKIVHVGTPVRRNMASTKGNAIPVTPDRSMSNLPHIAHEPSPSAVNHHGYHHPNLPIMYPHRYGITQLPPPLPPPMPSSTMSPPPNMPRRPRQFECNRPVKISKKSSNSKVEKVETTSSSCEAKMPHDEALQLNSLPILDDEFMNFEPDQHITEDVFEEVQDNIDPFAIPSKNAEDDDILDMIKGDVWNLDMDTFNYDEEPFKFLSD